VERNGRSDRGHSPETFSRITFSRGAHAHMHAHPDVIAARAAFPGPIPLLRCASPIKPRFHKRRAERERPAAAAIYPRLDNGSRSKFLISPSAKPRRTTMISKDTAIAGDTDSLDSLQNSFPPPSRNKYIEKLINSALLPPVDFSRIQLRVAACR